MKFCHTPNPLSSRTDPVVLKEIGSSWKPSDLIPELDRYGATPQERRTLLNTGKVFIGGVLFYLTD